MVNNKKYVYFFGNKIAEGNGDLKNLLGGKGAGLAEMTRIGLPVPGGFTITTEVCNLFFKNNNQYPDGLEEQVERNLKNLEKIVGKKLGDPEDPLLVSVRSGAPISMPGMMETILNLGLNDNSVLGLAKKTQNERFAYDAYRRFILMYSSTAKNIAREKFDSIFEETKNIKTRSRLNIPADKKVADTDLNTDELKDIVEKFKAVYKNELGEDFPQDPMKQLWGAIDAVFHSWMGEKAVKYREVEKISNIYGTAVNVVQMVFGNMGETSGTGVCFTRDPNTGENIFYGDYLVNAQGEDVVAGIRTPMKLDELHKKNAILYDQLVNVRKKLEHHYRDMQDLEFTVEDNKLYMLQCRSGKRSPKASFVIAYDLVQEGALYLCEHYGKHLNDVIGYSKKGKPITIEIACVRKMMKLINLKTRDYYRSVSLEALTPVSEPSYEIKEEIIQDYSLYEKIVSSLNLTENMRIALECRQNGLSYPEIARVLSRAQATVYEYFIKMRKRYTTIYG